MRRTTKGVCADCHGSGQVTGTPAPNGLALAADCPSCNGTGRR
ncbi:hypothetical protein [Nonomuraea turcica]|nr:hypothetical protein [Nonomuraea sp. G32]MDP4501115.1 hypothetical protein [Nonomuraea sp. G32]